MIRKLWLNLILLLLAHCIQAQSPSINTDSLSNLLKKNLTDRQKITVYKQLLQNVKTLDSLKIATYASDAIQLSKQLNAQSDLSDIYRYIGKIYYKKREYPRAIQAFHQALKAIPNHTLPYAKTLFNLGITHWKMRENDNALKYAMQALDQYEKLNNQRGIAKVYDFLGAQHFKQNQLAQSLAYRQKALGLYQTLGNKSQQALMLNMIGVIYKRMGKYKQSIKHYKKALRISKTLSDKKNISKTYRNIGVVYRQQGAFLKAMEVYHKALRIKEEINDQQGLAGILNNIGALHKFRNANQEALVYYKKCLEIEKKLNNHKGIARCYNNIGNIYLEDKQYSKALSYHVKNLNFNQKAGDTRRISISYYNLGDIYYSMQEYDKALSYFQKSFNIVEDKRYKLLLPFTLVSLGKTYRALGHSSKALDYLQRGFQKAQKLRDPVITHEATLELAQAYAATGNYKAAYEKHRLFKLLDDSLSNKEDTRKIAFLEAEYASRRETDSLQNINAHQVILLEKEAITIRFQRNINLLAIILLLIVITFATSYFLGHKKQKKLNNQLSQQSQVLQVSQEEIAHQRDRLASQNTALSFYQSRIKNSFKAAQIIQNTIFPTYKEMTSYFRDHFILFSPKDVVSGDFYWVTQVKNRLILVMADCTGHGVPGAFMTLIGTKILDKIVKIDQVLHPAQILSQLNDEVITSLQKAEKNNIEINLVAGMDAIALSIQPQEASFEINFAGAKSSLLYFDAHQRSFHEIRGSRKSIGGFQSGKRLYPQETLHLPPHSILYVGSDGLADQNDSHRRRFGRDQLKQVLHKNAHLSMDQQKEQLELALQTHMQDNEQRDDILWIGLKL